MSVVILGAGPAGMAAGYVLARDGDEAVVLEKSDTVGGISRTICYQGYYFDLGGHRFFTKYDEVQKLWEEVLGDEFLVRPRLSRIFYDGHFYDYPLKASNALRNLGLVESTRCMASYARARLRPRGQEQTFEEWVSNRFGDRLFDIFFRTYTEKVWGIPTSELGAEWASQRIKNMELSTAVRKALTAPLRRALGREAKADVTSLIEQFNYPRTGPGLMYDRMRQKTEALGGRVKTGHDVVRIVRDGFRVSHVVARRADGTEVKVEGDHFLSSIPLTLLVLRLDPAAPEEVQAAARALTFRHLVTIDLIIDHPDLFPDNWIYVHDKNLLMGRIQNFKNWSPYMVPDPARTSLGLEYFCSDHEPLWKMDVEELVALGKREIAATGLLRGPVVDGTAIKVPRAYPVYKRGYETHLARITDYVKRFVNLQCVGRYGMFKYNNADHSILTALLAIENTRGASHDIWAVNSDTEYHEVRKS